MDEKNWSPFKTQVLVGSSFGLPAHQVLPIGYPPSELDETDALSKSVLGLSFGKSPTSSDLWLSGPDDSPSNTPVTTPVRYAKDVSDLYDFPAPAPNHHGHNFGNQRNHHASFEHAKQAPQQRTHHAFTSAILQTPVRSSLATILFRRTGHSLDAELIYRLKYFFAVHVIDSTAEGQALLSTTSIDAMVTSVGGSNGGGDNLDLARVARASNRRLFIAVFSPEATNNAHIQTECNRCGVNMVTDDTSELVSTCVRALKVIGRPMSFDQTFGCPVCGFDGLMEDELCDHVVLYHGGQPNCDVNCPICGIMCKNTKVPFPVHMHKAHGNVGRARQNLPRKQHHTYIFVLVVCQRESDGKFLMVNEPASWGWWLPGGRVEWGEGLRAAALRETREEAGMDVDIQGILKFEYTSGPSRTRQRIIFFARPCDDSARPKCIPDYESRGACWVSLEEAEKLPLRGEEPRTWFRYIKGGGEIHSINLLSQNRDEE